MKRNIIGGAFTLASLMLAGHALAEDGVVHFVGEIVDTTCEVTSDTADQTVPLGKVSKNAFSGVGSLASPQQFSIKLEKCPATYTQAAVRFDGTEAPGGDGDLKVGTPLTARATLAILPVQDKRLRQRVSVFVFLTSQITRRLNFITILPIPLSTLKARLK